MSSMMDLREHFSLWERCGNTFFWRELGTSPHSRVLVNPVRAVMITARSYPGVPWPPPNDSPALEIWVKDAYALGEDEIVPAVQGQYRWVQEMLSGFFTGLMLIRIGLSKFDSPEAFVEKYFADQTREYKETGEGHISPGKDELLEATKRVLGSIGKEALVLHKIILREEWDEFLEGYGILEC